MRISDWSSDVCSSDLVAWKREIGEVQLGRPQLGRRHPDQHREQMARLRKLLTELWNFAGIGLILALRVERFDKCAFARLAAFPGEIDVVLAFLEERWEACRVGKESVSTCRHRWSLNHSNRKKK